MSRPTESTRLLSGPHRPEYVFHTSQDNERKTRVKQFQCCLCGIFLTIVSVALVAIVAYSMNSSRIPADNSTSDEEVVPEDSFLVLLSNTWPISDAEYNRPTLNDALKWEESIEAAKKLLKDRDELEKHVPSLPLRSPSYRHQKVVATSGRARNLSRIGYMEEFALKHMLRNASKGTGKKICYNSDSSLSLPEFCKSKRLECNRFQKYRSYDGTCNNLQHPESYGVAYIPFRRALPPDYADGISKPRVGKDGKPLPPARTVSLTVHRPCSKDDAKFSVMLAVWGQFLDHDITATALAQKSNSSTISCCGDAPVKYPECFPVELDPGDPLSEYNVTCLEFLRSAPAPKCCLGPREQMNQVTAFIDGSVVYGAEEGVTKKMRTFQNGTLKMYVTEDGRSLLPVSDDLSDGCNREEERVNGKYCFLTGDARANENLHLTSMHLLWARHHNLLALNLSKLNPHWDDETVFQEARRIVAAQIQHITYNEFLPILLGDKLMRRFDLSPKRNGYFLKYNASINSNIENGFAAAAFRFGHSIIPGLMKLLANDTSSPEFIQMHKMLFDPFRLYKAGELDRTLRGAMNTNIETSDPYFTSELKTHLFEMTAEQVKQPKLHGLDLVSLNIQRGRDHGLPGYSSWREHCGLKKPKDFDDITHDTGREALENIKNIYRDVDDVDLYTGALSETPVEGSILGPTLTCLILDQFVRLKYGDRFWYENPGEPQAFTLGQLNEIRKTTLANIICDNSDDLDAIQRSVMEGSGSKDRYVRCSQLGRPNISLWRTSLSRLVVVGDSLSVVVLKEN